jgi:16S rRNA (cytosine1402-N4)-methyltransferase
MTARSGNPSAVGFRRGPRGHIPVLLPEVLAALAPRAGERFIDGTFGGGGHATALLGADPSVRVLGIDRDSTAIANGRELVEASGGRLTLVEGRFAGLEGIAEATGFAPADGILLDIGVSSMQLDEPERGFSFQADGPLDMRMSRSGPSAADVVNAAEEKDLADILYHLGEERRSRAIARAIVARRREAPLQRTAELAAVVERVLGRGKPGGRHPATRTFQALRIYVNDELGELAQGLAAAERTLAPGGRLAVITFHSLEDGLVKRFLADRAGREKQASRHLPPSATARPAPSFRLVRSGATAPSEAELAANPRARSAKLRAAVRTDAPPWPADAAPAVPRR